MERTGTDRYKLIPLLLLSLILLIGHFYSAALKAENSPTQPKGTQLAYFVGYHSYTGGDFRPSHVYYGRKSMHRRLYWTGWKYIGYGCQQSCLIDRWSGKAIRCGRRC